MATEEQNSFGMKPQPQPQPGMSSLVPQQNYGGLPQDESGSYFSLSPEAMQMLWAPQPTAAPPLPPQPQQF